MLAKIGLFKKIKIDISLFEEGVVIKYKEKNKIIKKIIETEKIVKITSFSFSIFSQIVLTIISLFALKMSIYLFIIILGYIYMKYILSKVIIINTTDSSNIITFDKKEDSENYKKVFCNKWGYKCSFFKRKNKDKKE